jgi:hypothetical protein
MRNLFRSGVLLVCMSGVAAGQAAPATGLPGPRYELYGGFSRMRADIGTDRRPNGWAASFAVRLNRWIGVEAASGGGYTSVDHTQSTKLHYLLFGPRLAFPVKRLTPFIQVSVGMARWDLQGRGGETRVAKAGGLGLDVRITDRISARLIQADYLNTRFNDHDNAVVSAGIVVGLGRR